MPVAGAQSLKPWTYTQIFPAARYAVPQSRPGIAEPVPPASTNPYNGVGGIVQAELHWQDFFGNRTLSPFENQGPATKYPLNRLPMRFGISDGLLGLNRWTSTRFDYYFDSDGGRPTLFIELSFDTSRYDPELTPPPQFPGDLPGWEKNALADRQTYATVYYQMNHRDTGGKPSLTASVTSTVDGNQEHAITGNQFDTLAGYV